MFEVHEPATQRAVDLTNDRRQIVPIVAVSLGPDGVFEFLQALLARETVPPFEVIAQEVKAVVIGVHDFRFRRVKRQAGLRRPLSDRRQGRFCFFAAATQDHEVICIPYHLVAPFGHQVVQRVQVDVAE